MEQFVDATSFQSVDAGILFLANEAPLYARAWKGRLSAALETGKSCIRLGLKRAEKRSLTNRDLRTIIRDLFFVIQEYAECLETDHPFEATVLTTQKFCWKTYTRPGPSTKCEHLRGLEARLQDTATFLLVTGVWVSRLKSRHNSRFQEKLDDVKDRG